MTPTDLPGPTTDLLAEAFSLGATDIHIDQAAADTYRIRYRVDGVVHASGTLPADKARHLVNQVKVVAELQPERSRSPQESRFSVPDDEAQREVRVTVVPTSRGEALHLRILAAPSEILEPEQLGLSEEALARIQSTLKRPEGLMLISGPTGAGKTLTLYSLVSFLNLESCIVASVEDPVEYDLPNARQIQVDPQHGLSMKEALKIMLRMDPDVLMVGEIRDAASATTAVRAAASGRFVLATLHARDVPLALEALHYFSIPRHLLRSTLRLAVSQDLVRRLCKSCAGERPPTDEEREMFTEAGIEPPRHVPVPNGCSACHDFGYQGRIGIFEVVALDRSVRNAIAEHQDSGSVRQRIQDLDIPSKQQDALQKVAQGITSMEEIRDLYLPGDHPMDEEHTHTTRARNA